MFARFQGRHRPSGRPTSPRFLAGLLVASAGLVHGQGIPIAFHNGTTTRNAMTSRPPGEVVDTAASTWNEVVNNGGVGLAFADFTLRDTTGADTGARLSVVSGYSGYNSNGWGSGSQDSVMMEGWYGFRDAESIVVTGLPAFYADGFSVIVYGDSNTTSRRMHYHIGEESRVIEDAATFSGAFDEGANFVAFSGLTGSGFTLTGNAGASDARSAVNGLLILPGELPQPPTIDHFSADDQYVEPGSRVTLSWETAGADSLTIEPGVGVVSGPSGSVEVVVERTAVFTLTAANADGERRTLLRVGAGPPRPNILFFLVDDMGWQDTSVPFLHDAAGNAVVTPLNQRYRTPGMERLASTGMKFTSAYAMPVCTPTRNCWMTGLNSARHHVTNWTNPTGGETGNNTTPSHNSPADWRRGGLADDRVTLPSLLQAAGYRTIHAGKAHFGATAHARDPLNVGFDVNIAGSEIGHPASYHADDNFGGGSNHVPGLEDYHGSGLFLTEVLTREMNAAISRAGKDGAPFFAYLAHYAVHAPFQTDPRFSANYPSLSGSQLAYATLIEGMDKSLGDILAHLEDLGIAENTLVVFMSDNGGDAPISPNSNDPVVMDNAPLRHKKGSKYEGGVRVPLIVSWASPEPENRFQSTLSIAPGSHQDDMVAVFDLFPTFASVAGIAPDLAVDGFDLSPYLRGDSGRHRPQELLLHYPHDHRSDYFSILREGDWKLIYNYPNDTFELYNLVEDISEAADQVMVERERTMRMARRMARQLADAGAQWPTFASSGGDDPFRMPVFPTVDLDNDGIPDVQEDEDRDGLLGSGETDPENDDTDGDSTPDGAEVRVGTDPLDPTAFFELLDIGVNESEHLVLRWPSSPGTTYRLESAASLPGSWSPGWEAIPAAPAGATTVFDAGPVPEGQAVFFRVALE
jgi:arylsulfatase A-like enzyme